jgi:hypothetical protein
MAVSIKVGENFDCLVCAPFSPRFGGHAQLGEGLWASDGLPVALAEHWEKWLGTLIIESLRRSLVLTVTGKQPKPGIVYQEALRRRLYRLQYALSLLGICGYDEAFYIAGANEKGVPEVRQFGRIRRTFYLSRGMPTVPFGLEELNRAVRLAERMLIVDKKGPEWRRLRRGIDALNLGLSERDLQDARLHQFVRVLEALVLPEQGRSKNQFAHRCQTFTLANTYAKEALSEAYEIRSKMEHLHSAIDGVSGTGTEEEKEETLYQRARQMDQLARFAITRVLESDTLLAIFKADATIEEFWKKSDDERIAIWGERLDLEAVA